MSDASARLEQAAQHVSEGIRLHEAAAIPEAVASLRMAVLLYASAFEGNRAADAGAPEGLEAPERSAPTLLRARADACQLCGDYLTEVQEHAEAANVYQEAADLYAQIGGAETEREAQGCARKILTSVAALRNRPHERLYLLVRRYERRQRQFALEPGTERQQGACSAHIARIFQRQERYEEAVARYREALSLFERAPQDRESAMGQADCHHRLATLLSLHLNDLSGAARHYRQAIALYALHEPVTYGVQSAHALCMRALAEVERRLQG
jgi:tetratricopeptide (TPR) repeat protein